MLRPLLIKLVITLAVSIVAFSFFDLNPAGWVIFVAVAATLVNYLVGDTYFSPVFSNLVASLGNGALAIAVAFITGLITPAFNPTLGTLLFFGAFIAVGEAFYHVYLLRFRKAVPEPEQQGE